MSIGIKDNFTIPNDTSRNTEGAEDKKRNICLPASSVIHHLVLPTNLINLLSVMFRPINMTSVSALESSIKITPDLQ